LGFLLPPPTLTGLVDETPSPKLAADKFVAFVGVDPQVAAPPTKVSDLQVSAIAKLRKLLI
jgi:hypothetical protein